MKESDEKIRKLSQQFFEKELRIYGDVIEPSAQDDENLKFLLISLAGDCKSFRLLDIGCGIGYVARTAKALYPDSKVVGTDISPAIIDRARELCSQGDIRFDVADELCLLYDDGIFDFVVCRFSIHHYPQMVQHLQEVHRVLKDDGTYLIIDVLPDSGQYDHWLNEFFVTVERRVAGHVKFYTMSEYNDFLQQTSFLAVRVERFSLLLDFSQDHMLFQPLERMAAEFQEMVSFHRYDDRFSIKLKAAGIFAQKK